MFEWPYDVNAKEYCLYISFDTSEIKKDNEFLIVKKEKLPISKIEKLALGKKYKWKIKTTLKTGKITWSDYHYFSIGKTHLMNKNKFQRSQKYHKKKKTIPGLIWCDQYRCAIDRDGEIVWFMTEEQNKEFETKLFRDIKLYPDGSITFVNQPNAAHVDINFNIIWKAPEYGKIAQAKQEDYHHDLEILSNGNYMVLGNEKVKFSNESNQDTTISDAIDFCNIIEFNKNDTIVWAWQMKDHFPYELLIDSRIKTSNGIVNPHANSFCVDEKNGFIFLSFRDISRIIKIDKNTKRIVASYGTKLNSEDDIFETDLFKLQHDIQLLDNNNFLIFNNNDIDSGKISSVDIIHFPVNEKDQYELLWRFYLNYDSDSKGKVQRMGGVKIMPDGHYLICEGSNNRIVEINKEKEILWDFSLRQIDTSGKVNDKFAIYRANFSYSLYPNYFGAYIGNDELTIINKGHMKDAYILSIYDNSFKIIKSIDFGEVLPEEIKKISFSTIGSEFKAIEIRSKNTNQLKYIKVK